MYNRKSEIQKGLNLLFLKYGYTVEEGRIYSLKMKGWNSRRLIGRCRSMMDATEQLIPIIRNDDFSERVRTILKPE